MVRRRLRVSVRAWVMGMSEWGPVNFSGLVLGSIPLMREVPQP